MSVRYDRKPLDPSLYFLDPTLADLFKASTGINDDEELKTHILQVQADAYEAFPYPCIRLFSFTRLSVPEVPGYQQVLKLGQERKEAIFLEIGTGFGNDIRKVVDDGFPAEKIVVSDINPQLWEIGHRLFRSDAQKLPLTFVEADVFDEAALSSTVAPAPSLPALSTLRTLTPLKGHASVILLQMVFHLWNEKRQAQLAHRVAQLLSSAPGSLIVGRQMGDSSPGELSLQGQPHFVHNPQTWENMWSKVFPKGTVEYHTELRDLPPDLMAATMKMLGVGQFLTWSIKRL